MKSSSFNAQPNAISVDFDPFAQGEISTLALATESQKEIWASVQMGSDANCAYNESVSLWLRGKLEIETLRSAFQELVQRHESLRTTLSPDGDHLYVAEFCQFEIPLVDWSQTSDSERSKNIATVKQQAVSTPFDLEQGPLFRVKVFRLNSEEHWVVLTAHHIIFDGWSWGVVIPELSQLYSAFCNGQTPSLEEPDRFSEYASILQEAEDSEETRTTEAYWLQQFAETIPVLDFPTDRPRPPLRTFNSARENWDLPESLIIPLKQLGTRLGCSFMTTMLASFEVFLYRLTGQEDVIVGVPTAGQAACGQYNLVGHCVNLLPLRSRLNAPGAFTSYLQSRQSDVLDAYDHQQFTFGRLVQKLSIPRDASRVPLVPILFNLDQGLETEKLLFDGLDVELSSNPRIYENFEIFINATELKDKVTLECQYNTHLFDALTVRRRLAEFQTLLEGIVSNPEQSIAMLPLLPKLEQQLIAQWNDSKADYPQNLCLHQLVEAQAAKTPDKIAVIFEDQELTYRVLDQKANQVAHYLCSLEIGPEQVVGLCCDRNLEMVIGVLGILKAGAAYLPLDPTYPQERLAFMAQDAHISVLLTQSHLIDKLPNIQTVCLDSDWTLISSKGTHPPISGVTPNNLAYIIYTSGSTGQPKGVQLPHRNAVNLLHAVREQPGLTAADTLLSVTTLSFDISVSELFLPLMVGAKLVIVRQAVATDGLQLLEAIRVHSPTFMQPTPATWRMLIAADWTGSPNLKMISTGEALPQDLAQQLLPLGKELWNLYGPTETTIWSTGYRIEADNQPITIGYPIANTQLHILDRNRQPVPIGVPGELHIGGAGIARGYLNNAELTAEKFVTYSLGANSNTRLYKTGDLVRWLSNGQAECLGRIDDQVKVRGFRIELKEIEANLLQHPVVKEAAVIVREDVPGERMLVGYFVPASGTAQDTSEKISEVRQFLQSRLPDFMVPNRFMALDSMPLTPNGKVDRKGLPKPDLAQQFAASYMAPTTTLEKQIADIWAQVFNLERVGIQDNFFELGGYSLLAIQIVSRLRKELQVEVLLPHLFEVPTVADLAHRIKSLRWAAQDVPLMQDENDYEEGEL